MENPDHSLNADQLASKYDVSKRTIQRNMTNRRNARQYRKIQVKPISLANKRKRVDYGEAYRGRSIKDYWQFVYFTDEAHFRSEELANKSEYEYRQSGTEQRLANLQETTSSSLNVTLHVAAGISWHGKGMFEFYNDPDPKPLPGTFKPRKPRRSGVETIEQHTEAIRQFEQVEHGQSVDVEIKPKGNSMTQQFYAREILPKHLDHVEYLQRKYGHPILFQEDNDPSHGTRSYNNVAARLKRERSTQILSHPPQSPDLNPEEPIWMMIKQRIRGGTWSTIDEFKEAILGAWRGIRLNEIQRRISEMPLRCQKMIETGGKRYKSGVW
jgi:hypothetical protein